MNIKVGNVYTAKHSCNAFTGGSQTPIIQKGELFKVDYIAYDVSRVVLKRVVPKFDDCRDSIAMDFKFIGNIFDIEEVE